MTGALVALLGACSFDGVSVETGDGDGGGDAGAMSEVTVSFRMGENNYQGVSDTEIDEDEPGEDRSAGDEMTYREGRSGGPGPTYGDVMGLLRFDDIFGTGANQVPPGATLSAATLSVTVMSDGFFGRGAVCDMLATWSGPTTWDAFGGGMGPKAALTL